MREGCDDCMPGIVLPRRKTAEMIVRGRVFTVRSMIWILLGGMVFGAVVVMVLTAPEEYPYVVKNFRSLPDYPPTERPAPGEKEGVLSCLVLGGREK